MYSNIPNSTIKLRNNYYNQFIRSAVPNTLRIQTAFEQIEIIQNQEGAVGCNNHGSLAIKHGCLPWSWHLPGSSHPLGRGAEGREDWECWWTQHQFNWKNSLHLDTLSPERVIRTSNCLPSKGAHQMCIVLKEPFLPNTWGHYQCTLSLCPQTTGWGWREYGKTLDIYKNKIIIKNKNIHNNLLSVSL